MIYIFIGGSRAGKSSVIKNTFMTGELKHKKDLLPYCETDTAYILGNYQNDITRTGLDSISRSAINDIVPQVLKLYNNGSGKHIVLDGDKATSRTVYNELLKNNCEIKTYWMKVSPQISILRSHANGIPTGDSHLRALCTKAENIYWEYCDKTNGEIIETDRVRDFTTLTIYNYVKIEKKPMRDDFAIFILTHGRAKHMYTLKTIQKAGYNGKWFMIIDDEDETADEYYELYGKNRVIMFHKQEVVDRTDTMDLLNEHKAIVYARNESFKIARDLGLKYFMMLDDDVTYLSVRYLKDGKLKGPQIKDLNRVITDMIDVLDSTNAITIAMCQGGDLIGGKNCNRFEQGMLRKAMNSFICRADNPIEFRGTMNEDVVTYTTLGSRGELFLSFVGFIIVPKQSQSVDGGMTQVYLDSGTYVKSFYSVMSMPSCVKIGWIKDSYARIHHNVQWNYCVPKILNECHRKTDDSARDRVGDRVGDSRGDVEDSVAERVDSAEVEYE